MLVHDPERRWGGAARVGLQRSLNYAESSLSISSTFLDDEPPHPRCIEALQELSVALLALLAFSSDGDRRMAGKLEGKVLCMLVKTGEAAEVAEAAFRLTASPQDQETQLVEYVGRDGRKRTVDLSKMVDSVRR